VRESHPVAPADLGERIFVVGVVAEVVAMTFDGEAGVFQDLRKAQSRSRSVK
jgi:hypothetical protein